MQEKRWRIATPYKEESSCLASALSVSPFVAQLLWHRGIQTVEEAKHFLYDSVTELLNPFLLQDMDLAVARIQRAIDNQESIVIYGDYDVDGITATSLLTRFFRSLGANVSYYIPERQSEGYGLNLEALEYLIEKKTDLVITVDCGISSFDIVEEVKDRLDMIITDHHNIPGAIPKALAVINPKREDCSYPDKILAGVGVAFKLAQAVYLERTGQLYLEDLDIVALGTVADVVPLIGENRIFVREGLQKMNHKPLLGIQKLIQVAGLGDKIVSAGHIGFSLAPRLNAAGRVTHASIGVQLLTSQDEMEAEGLAEELQVTNMERQQIEKGILEEARKNVLQQGDMASKVLVVAGAEWHPGVIGIVASRLVEEFYKPTLMIAVHDGVGKGSCRSIENFDMYEALKSAEDILIQFGGHKAAAGFTIEAENIPLLRERLNAYCKENLTADDYVPNMDIDVVLTPDEVSVPLIDSLEVLEPYGMGNASPIFGIEVGMVEAIQFMGYSKQHIKIHLSTSHGPLDAISWFGAELFREIFRGDRVKVAFTLQKNEWLGRTTPQLLIRDIQVLDEEVPVLTEVKLREAYKTVKQLFHQPNTPKYVVETAMSDYPPTGMSRREAMLALDVFKELGILEEEASDRGNLYRWVQIKNKLDLVTSVTFLQYSE